MALKENSRIVYDWVVAHDGEDFTAKDIAAATGLTDKQVNGIVTSAFQRKGLMAREEVAITGGTVKYVRLTDEGRAFNPDSQE